MTPRRLGPVLLAAAAVAAIGALLLVRGYVDEVAAQVGPTVPVLHLRADAPRDLPIPRTAVVAVDVPARWAPRSAIRDVADLVGVVPAADLPSGTMLQSSILVPQPVLAPGQRELAILVDAETAVAGKVRPGDHVDVLATFAAAADRPATADLLLQRVRVVDVGAPAAADADLVTGLPVGEVVPVTFALTVADSRRLAYAEAFATSVRLALRPADDLATVAAPGTGAPWSARAGAR